jgi:voltage-gated potassium channel
MTIKMTPAPNSAESNSPPPPSNSVRNRAALRFGAFRYSAVELLAALALLFLVTPFVEDLPNGDLLEAGLLTLVMVFAVLAVGGRRRTLIAALGLVTPALVAKWANHVRPDLVPPEIFLAAGMVFFIFVITHLLRFILRAPRVDASVLCAGISGYLLLGLLWVPAYLLVARLSPAAFSLTAGPDAGHPLEGFNAFYFSFITLCTVGYGDVIPISKAARMLAMLEAITGVFYVAVLISRLVSIYSSSQPAPVEPLPPGKT